MSLYHLLIILTVVAIAIAIVNHRFVKLPMSIAIMSAALLASLSLIFIEHNSPFSLAQHLQHHIAQLDFGDFVLNGVLSFLLFAGALTINIDDLKACRWEIAILSSFSTILSAGLVGVLIYYILMLLQINLPFIYCLLFGALISPTDPIAVLAIIKQLRAPKTLETMVAGESLFNDGVGIVIFLTLYAVAFQHTPLSVLAVGKLFLQQSIGGIIYGLVLGFVVLRIIQAHSNHGLKILASFCIPSGGYLLAEQLHVSGPLAMVVAGIIMAKVHDEYFHVFWEVIDELLNAILFLLIGLEVLVLSIHAQDIWLSLLAIPLVLLVRYITVAIPMLTFKRYKTYPPYLLSILTWGGLRGALAVAMALALPKTEHRELVLSMTYAVVVFAIIVQGTSAKWLVQKSLKAK